MIATILTTPSASPGEWAASCYYQAAANIKTDLEGRPDFDSDKFDAAVTYIIQWLLLASKREVVLLVFIGISIIMQVIM